jgi:long-chain acyl-CoA synthetase
MKIQVGLDVSAARSAAYLARVLELVLADNALSLPQYRLLCYLSGGSSAASPAAKDLSTSRPSVTALVDGVVAKGLVERLPDPGDRRRITLMLTAHGVATLARADEEITERLGTLASFLSAADQEKAVTGLSLWRGALRAEGDAARAGVTEGGRQ